VPPNFREPPVVEVALGVQFKDPLPLGVAHLGALWAMFKDTHPQLAEQPPLPPAVELLDGDGDVAPVDFPLYPPRLWFLTEKQEGLVQVQRDRFIANWRKVSADQAYPRFPVVMQAFRTGYGTFESFLRANDLPDPEPALCELTYVSHIVAGRGWERHDQVHEVFSGLQLPVLKAGGLVAEDADMKLRYVARDSEGRARARLHFRAFPAVRDEDRKPLFAVNIMARGPAPGRDEGGVERFFEDAHGWVVAAFMALTTAKMHAIWGLDNE
jgi:uncharacterized protein (TIGR04255 family)